MEAGTKKDIILSAIHSRQSIRSFISGRTIPRDVLETLVRAGMEAPSALNLRPWVFIAIDDHEIMNALAAALPYAKMLYHAGGAIAVCGDTDVRSSEHGYWEFDCSLASGNILMAVEAMGLGAVWTAVYPYAERVTAVQRILNLPKEIIPLNVIPIGYPTGMDDPKREKYNPNFMRWNKW
jgi:nitroreductase